MMCMYAKVPFKVMNYDVKMDLKTGVRDARAWYGPKKELKARDPFINLPHIIDHERDDLVVSQTNACLSYLGRRLGLWGRSEADIALVESLLCEIMDLRNKMIKFAYNNGVVGDMEGDARALLEDVKSKNGQLEKFSLHLTARRPISPFLMGYCTAADFHFFEMLDQFITLAKRMEVEFPVGLVRWHEDFKALEANEGYLKSRFHNELPFNNKHARFGSLPDGGKFVKGQHYAWGSQFEETLFC